MRVCPITYEELHADSPSAYSKRGLRLLSPRLEDLKPLPFTTEGLQKEAILRAKKLSIQGVQPKLSAKLDLSEKTFSLVDIQGSYILKPPHPTFTHVAENEDLSMRLAAGVGIEIPIHGLVGNADSTMTYFVRRFDRYGRNQKRLVEDFAQLSGRTRETKYDSSMEKVSAVITEHCTFPRRENEKLLRMAIFSFLTGNEDMHLKNFSLLAKDGIISLSPAYDLVNTTLVLESHSEELALPLNGKKRNLTKNDFLRYFAKERLQLTEKVIENILRDFRNAKKEWEQLITRSFLPIEKQEQYLSIVEERWKRVIL